MEEISISLLIGERTYRLTVKKEEEETIRKVARDINQRLQNYAQIYAYHDKQDLLAMIALELATQLETEKNVTEYKNLEIQNSIREIGKMLDQYIWTFFDIPMILPAAILIGLQTQHELLKGSLSVLANRPQLCSSEFLIRTTVEV